MIRILHIIPSLRKGGAERLVLDIIKNVSRKKEIDVKLIIFREEIEYDISEIKSLIDVVPCSFQLSLTKKWHVNVSRLQQFLIEFNPDVIHTHLFEAELVSRFCIYPKASWYSHIHDNMIQLNKLNFSSISKSTITNFFEKHVLFNRYKKNGGTHFLAISKHTLSYIKSVQYQYPVTLLHNAIDIKRFKKTIHIESHTTKLSKEVEHNPDDIDGLPLCINLINIGSFVPKKNQCFLLDIIIELNKKGIKVSCLFLGDGPLKNEIEERAIELGIMNQCQFLGNVEKVEEYLWHSDVYVHTATYEPLGLVLLEAMAAGLPVITLDGGGNRDLMNNGKNGYLIEKQEPDVFADRIIEVHQNKEISDFNTEFAKQYDIGHYCDRLLEIYGLVINESANLV